MSELPSKYEWQLLQEIQLEGPKLSPSVKLKLMNALCGLSTGTLVLVDPETLSKPDDKCERAV